MAKTDIYPQIFATTAQQQFCERLTFNPWHGLQAHRPVGGINRALRDVLPVMQAARLKSEGLTKFGPHELSGNETFK